MRKFHFVDFAAHYQKGFRNHVTAITEVPERVRSFKNYGCYATYFFFSDEILTYLGTEHEEGSKPSLAGYEGKVWAPYLVIDIDHKDFAVAREAAQFFLSFFHQQWQIDPNGLQVYFSGQKGFHLMLDTRLFGKTVGSKSLPQVFSAMRHHLTWELPEYLREAVDLSIKDRLRLWRLPNTIHEKSGLYKILVSEEELLKTPADEIKILAKKMRPLEKTDETGFLSHVPVRSNRNASQLYRRVQRQIKRMTQKPFQYHFRHPKKPIASDFPLRRNTKDLGGQY